MGASWGFCCSSEITGLKTVRIPYAEIYWFHFCSNLSNRLHSLYQSSDKPSATLHRGGYGMQWDWIRMQKSRSARDYWLLLQWQWNLYRNCRRTESHGAKRWTLRQVRAFTPINWSVVLIRVSPFPERDLFPLYESIISIQIFKKKSTLAKSPFAMNTAPTITRHGSIPERIFRSSAMLRMIRVRKIALVFCPRKKPPHIAAF